MDNSAVLKAGSSHAEWDQAIARLIATGYDKPSAETWLSTRFWSLTRVPDPLYAKLTANILTHGLFGEVQLFCEDWHSANSLIMLKFVPSKHWVHLLSPAGLVLRDLSSYPYHISICYMKDLWAGWKEKQPTLQALDAKYGAMKKVVLPIESFGSGASANIGDCELRRDLLPLWQTGSENYKTGLHISF